MYSKIVVSKKHFSNEWCDKIISHMDGKEPNPDLGKGGISRKCTVTLLQKSDPIFQDVYDELIAYVKQHIDKLNVDIDYNIDGNTMQYITYNPGDFVAVHNDTRTVKQAIDFKTNRKLSMTVILSNPDEYTGGEFIFDPLVKLPMKVEGKGTTALFTSHSPHSVTKILSGQRKILFIFLTGPEWR